MPFKRFWMLVCVMIGLQGLFPVYADEQVISQCDFDSLQVAIQTAGETGGIIRLECNASIFFEQQLIIQSDIHLIGLGDVVLDGDNRTRLFYVSPGASLTLENMTLQHSYISEIGGVLFNDGGKLDLTDVTITENLGETGGIIYNAGELTITDSIFVNNSGGVGVAIYNHLSPISIINSDFLYNTGDMGSIIYNNGGDITISEAHFFDNIGMVIENYQGGLLDIQKSILAKSSTQVENTAIRNENGVVLTENTHYENLICRGDITDNGGNTSDNARDCVGTDPHITDVVVENCRDFWGDGTLLDAVIIANAGGGEIRFTCDKIRVISRLPIGDDVRITGVDNVVLDGGGQNGIFRVEIGASLTLNHIQLQNGFAVEGSVIYNLGTLNIYNSALIYNHTQRQGAIYNWGGDVTIISSVFAHNKADWRGGAIYTLDGHLMIDDSVFFHNSARTSGAIDAEYTPIRVSNSDFVRNVAREGFGGGIGVRFRSATLEPRQASPLVIINSHFERNYAGDIGGAINSYEFVTIIDSTLYRNYSYHGSVASGWLVTVNSQFILSRNGCEFCRDIYARYLFAQHSYYESTTCAVRHIVDFGGNMAVNAEGCPGN